MDENFEEVGAGDTNGFYDFLRLPQGRIVGVRFTPFVEHADICNSAAQGPGLRVTGAAPTATFELFWGTEREYSETHSADQFMDYNYIFKSPSQKYAGYLRVFTSGGKRDQRAPYWLASGRCLTCCRMGTT
jgi:hypothetical protein